MIRLLVTLSVLALPACRDAAGDGSRTSASPPRTPPPAPAEAKPAPSGRVTRIVLSDFYALQQNNAALIYDVRPSFHFRLGHIPGAVSWPKSSYQDELILRETEMKIATSAGKPVVLYCTDLACPDARDVATRLAQRGHRVAVLEGGYEAWKIVTQ